MNHVFAPASFGNAPGVAMMPLLLIGLLLFCVGWLVIGTIYMRYTGLSRGRSAMLWFFSLVIALIGLAMLLPRGQREDQEIFRLIVFLMILSSLSVPFVVRLYRKLVGGHLTDAEKSPGMDGVRAWLTPSSLICAILIPVCAWQVSLASLPVMFALTFGLLLAYPVFNMASAAPQPAVAAPPEDLSAERERVLRLLEAGKITADESSDLLNALGSTVPSRPATASEMKMSPARKMVLLGAALLLIGFFLPWFSINPSEVVKEMQAQLQNFTGNLPLNMVDEKTAELQQNFAGMLAPGAHSQMDIGSGNVQIHAGDVAHGLGWWILALGISAAVLPFFITNLKADLQKKVIIAALVVGAFLLVYLLHDSLHYVSVGVVLALAGYALEFVGTLKERPVTH